MREVGNGVLQNSAAVSCRAQILLSCLSFTDHTAINTSFHGIDYIPFKLGNYIVFSMQ